MAGRDSHPLDDKQSFMKVSHPPIPFDQQGLVTLVTTTYATLASIAETEAWTLHTVGETSVSDGRPPHNIARSKKNQRKIREESRLITCRVFILSFDRDEKNRLRLSLSRYLSV